MSAADDITFTDTSKAIFGNSGDLEINHNATPSVNANEIACKTGKQLRITQDNLFIGNEAGDETFIAAINGGFVGLYHDGGEKLVTTSTGVGVTGNVSLSDNILFSSVNASDSALIVTNEGSTGVGAIFMQAGSGSGSGGGSVTCYANARAGGKDADVVVGLSNNSNGQFRINTSGVDVGTDVFTVSADGDTLITGNLTVDGAIIHGGGSATHTAKGGTFSDTINLPTNGTATEAFTIERTNGSMVFDVYFTNDSDGTSASVAKKFTVVKQYGTAATTISSFKILDTGPGTFSSNTFDFTPEFLVSGTSSSKLKCMITPIFAATNVTYTIFLGNGSTDATIVLN